MLKKLLLIFIFGLLARLAFLDSFPPSLNWDEASLGYNAYSLQLTGRDEWGQVMPVLFRAFGDYKLPGYIYFSVLPQFLLGLNPLATRLTSAVAGSLLILVIFVISRRLGLSGLLSSFISLLVCLSPWSWFLSRVAVESNLGLLTASLGLALLMSRRQLSGWLFLGLSAWIYNSYRVVIPAFALVLLFTYGRRFFKISSVLLLGLLLTPVLFQLLSPGGQSRFAWLNILDSGAIGTIESLRNQSRLDPPLARLVYNRPVYFAARFAGNYLSHFSPAFLFISGGSHYQFSIPGHGLLFVFTLPFFYFGVWVLITARSPAARLVLVWLLVSPLAGSLVRDAPHALRALGMFPAVVLAIGLGIRAVVKNIWYLRLLLVALVVSFAFYTLAYLPRYYQTYSWAWQYENLELAKYLRAHSGEYDQIIITKQAGEPHIFLLYYLGVDPGQYRSDPELNRYFRSNWYWVDSFSRYRFVVDRELADFVKNLPAGPKYLIVSTPRFDAPGRLIRSLYYLDNQTAYYLKEK